MAVFSQVSPLPENVTLSQIQKTIPKEAFEKNDFLALRSVAVTVIATGLGLYMIHISPFWLLPFAWIYTGTAATGLFVIGHDCGHRSFFKSLFWNDVVGTLAFAPLLYPFHAWRIQHNVHHNNTNKLHVDTAWHPVMGKDYVAGSSANKVAQRLIRSTPLYFIGSVGHWVFEHFNQSLFKGDDLDKVKSSVSIISYFSLIFFPLVFGLFGLSGIFKFWLVPWLGFHFWMSTFTLIHHTAPHIPFLEESKWRDTAALQYTVHCKYPAWVDFLCHDISVHVPHHVSPAIPHYRLRLAFSSIKKNWGPYVQECEFGLPLIWYILSNCHIYDDENGLYKTFAAFLKSIGVINPPNPATPKKKAL